VAIEKTNALIDAISLYLQACNKCCPASAFPVILTTSPTDAPICCTTGSFIFIFGLFPLYLVAF
jgi:hypothetical protein